jgi:hypothetical protein
MQAQPSTSEKRFERTLRCVSSGYLSGGCSCEETVPVNLVLKAWASELAQADICEDQFFRFIWRGGEWLGYGLRDGRVRGVYCPQHSAQRAERSSVQGVGVAS